MNCEWTELSLLQKQAGKVEQFRDLRQNRFSAFVLGAVLVFFLLAGARSVGPRQRRGRGLPRDLEPVDLGSELLAVMVANRLLIAVSGFSLRR
jgi:hypothetical protein